MKDKVLVVVAHPDDEALGCGATIKKYTLSGHEVHLVVLTDGVSARLGSSSGEIGKRNNSLKKSCEILGIKSYKQFDFSDNAMDSVPLIEIVRKIEDSIGFINPKIIITHFHGDLNIDHQLCSRAVHTACRPLPQSCVKQLMMFETVSSTEWSLPGSCSTFNPNFFIDVASSYDFKMKAIEAYSDEMRDAPHARSSENVINLMKTRGASCGVKYAESFLISRFIVSEL